MKLKKSQLKKKRLKMISITILLVKISFIHNSTKQGEREHNTNSMQKYYSVCKSITRYAKLLALYIRTIPMNKVKKLKQAF